MESVLGMNMLSGRAHEDKTSLVGYHLVEYTDPSHPGERHRMLAFWKDKIFDEPFSTVREIWLA